MTTPTVFQELADLRAAFDATRTLLAKGMRVDLTGMDDRVRDFCTLVQAADATTRQKIEPDFVALLGVLNDLETELRRLNDPTASPTDPQKR
ncbi:MAG: hypothetical protein WBK91_07380 [Alphaproteobacteria bacterium]